MFFRWLRMVLFFVIVACLGGGNLQPSSLASSPVTVQASAGQSPTAQLFFVYNQPPSASGGLYPSSRWDPNGSDYDQYVWDSFRLTMSGTISVIRWRGGFDPAKAGSGGPVMDFWIRIFPSIPAGTQPDIVHAPLAEYFTWGNAGQTPAGTFGGTALYDYTYTLPAPFSAVAGTSYWLQIEALQSNLPDWSIAAGAGGNGSHFAGWYGQAGLTYYTVNGDTAFSLLGPASPSSFFLFIPSLNR